MYVIVTNHVNWHRENLRSDRENTGNLKTQFEWVPCIGCPQGTAGEGDTADSRRYGDCTGA